MADPDAVDWHPHGGYRDSEELGAEEEYSDEAYEEWLDDTEDDVDYDPEEVYDVPF